MGVLPQNGSYAFHSNRVFLDDDFFVPQAVYSDFPQGLLHSFGGRWERQRSFCYDSGYIFAQVGDQSGELHIFTWQGRSF